MTTPARTPDTRYVAVDVETFGLNHETDPPIEVGFRVLDHADPTLVLAETSVLVWEGFHDDRLIRLCEDGANGDAGARLVGDMHDASSLFTDAILNGVSLADADAVLSTWLHEQGVTGLDPLFGGNVANFDRPNLARWLPEVERCFHYRNIDVSTIKEACRRVAPKLYARMQQEVMPAKEHRVLPDLTDTAAEYAWYKTHFLRGDDA